MRGKGRLYLCVRYLYFWDTAEARGPLQALVPGMETVYSEENTTSLLGGVPSTKPNLFSGFSLVHALYLLLILPPLICWTTSGERPSTSVLSDVFPMPLPCHP